MNDSKKRSIAKMVSWQVISLSFTLAIVYFFTGKLIESTKATFTALIVGTVMLYMHERIWNRINWGKS